MDQRRQAASTGLSRIELCPKVTVAKKFEFAEALLGLGSPVSSLGD